MNRYRKRTSCEFTVLLVHKQSQTSRELFYPIQAINTSERAF